MLPGEKVQGASQIKYLRERSGKRVMPFAAYRHRDNGQQAQVEIENLLH